MNRPFVLLVFLTVVLTQLTTLVLSALLPSGADELIGGAMSSDFTCDGRNYGYYGDQASQCQLFHVCLPVTNDLGQVVEYLHFPFVCGNQTVFNQESLTCTFPEDALPCELAHTIYDLSNDRLTASPRESFPSEEEDSNSRLISDFEDDSSNPGGIVNGFDYGDQSDFIVQEEFIGQDDFGGQSDFVDELDFGDEISFSI